MLRDTAVSIIAQRLGNRTDLDAKIVTEMQLVQDTLERAELLPFFLLTEMATTQTTAGEERVAIPSDFLKEFEEGALWYYNSGESPSWKPLARKNIQDVKGAFTSDEETGAPQYYTLTGNYYRIAPVPDDVYILKQFYYAKDTVLSSNVENNWLKFAAEWFICETGVRISAYIQNDKMVQLFARDLAKAKDAFWRYNEGRKHSNQDYRMEYR